MQEPGAAAEQRLGMDALAIRRVAIERRWRHVDPQDRSSRRTTESCPVLVFRRPARAPGRWYRLHAAQRRRGHGGRSLPPGGEQELGLSHPISQRGAVEIDAFAGIDDGLAVQRRVVTILRDQHMRDQARPRPPRSIGSDGMGACTIVSHDRQLSFGRRCWITLKLDGTYRAPRARPVRPAERRATAARAGAGRLVDDGPRGRWAGSGVRTGCLR